MANTLSYIRSQLKLKYGMVVVDSSQSAGGCRFVSIAIRHTPAYTLVVTDVMGLMYHVVSSSAFTATYFACLQRMPRLNQ